MRRQSKVFGLWLVCIALVAGATGVPAYAGPTYSFTNITNNNSLNADIGEAQLFVEVIDSGGLVTFRFTNTGPEACSITDVYFDDGALLGISSIENSTGVSFSEDASPPNLPGGHSIVPPFDTTEGFSADSDSPPPLNGVNPGEEVSIVFSLKGDNTYQDVLSDLASGDLRIGIHVQAFANGGSEAFVNNRDPLIPAPGAVLLASLGIGMVGWLRQKKLV